MPYLFGKVNGLLAKVGFMWESRRKNDAVKKEAKKIVKEGLRDIISKLEELDKKVQ
jgi:hypothetical protein